MFTWMLFSTVYHFVFRTLCPRIGAVVFPGLRWYHQAAPVQATRDESHWLCQDYDACTAAGKSYSLVVEELVSKYDIYIYIEREI